MRNKDIKDIKKYEIKNSFFVASTVILLGAVFVWFLAIGFTYSNNYTIKAYSGQNSIVQFRSLVSAYQGRDIFGSSIVIIVFSILLLLNSVMNYFIFNKKRVVLRINLYILNYLFLIIIFALSVVILVEYLESASLYFNSYFSLSTIFSIIFIGIIWPLIMMIIMFDKKVLLVITRVTEAIYEIK